LKFCINKGKWPLLLESSAPVSGLCFDFEGLKDELVVLMVVFALFTFVNGNDPSDLEIDIPHEISRCCGSSPAVDTRFGFRALGDARPGNFS
jgi:hypothetical protein